MNADNAPEKEQNEQDIAEGQRSFKDKEIPVGEYPAYSELALEVLSKVYTTDREDKQHFDRLHYFIKKDFDEQMLRQPMQRRYNQLTLSMYGKAVQCGECFRHFASGRSRANHEKKCKEGEEYPYAFASCGKGKTPVYFCYYGERELCRGLFGTRQDMFDHHKQQHFDDELNKFGLTYSECEGFSCKKSKQGKPAVTKGFHQKIHFQKLREEKELRQPAINLEQTKDEQQEPHSVINRVSPDQNDIQNKIAGINQECSNDSEKKRDVKSSIKASQGQSQIQSSINQGMQQKQVHFMQPASKLDTSLESDCPNLVALKMKALPRGKSVFPLFSDLNDAWNQQIPEHGRCLYQGHIIQHFDMQMKGAEQRAAALRPQIDLLDEALIYYKGQHIGPTSIKLVVVKNFCVLVQAVGTRFQLISSVEYGKQQNALHDIYWKLNNQPRDKMILHGNIQKENICYSKNHSILVDWQSFRLMSPVDNSSVRNMLFRSIPNLLEDKLALLWVLADLQFVRWIQENMRDPSNKKNPPSKWRYPDHKSRMLSWVNNCGENPGVLVIERQNKQPLMFSLPELMMRMIVNASNQNFFYYFSFAELYLKGTNSIDTSYKFITWLSAKRDEQTIDVTVDEDQKKYA